MQQTILAVIALLVLGLAGCATTREPHCDGTLEPINAAPAKAVATPAGDPHDR